MIFQGPRSLFSGKPTDLAEASGRNRYQHALSTAWGIWMFECLMFRKVELWVVGLICVAAFVGMILVSAIARKTAEGNTRFGLVGDAALALSTAPEKLMRTARMLIAGTSIRDMIRHLRNEDYLIGDPRNCRKGGVRLLLPGGDAPRCRLSAAQPL